MAPKTNTNHFPLKQIEYRSFIRTIELYHYPHHLLPISRYEAFLTTVPGFVRRLESRDTLCDENGAEKGFVPDGDEVPVGITEVAYLSNVFQKGGSALGFRLLDEDRCVWICFDRPITALLSTAKSDTGEPLFERVADLERGPRGRALKGTVQGYPEHRYWYDGLAEAEKPVVPLSKVEESRSLLDATKIHDASSVQTPADEPALTEVVEDTGDRYSANAALGEFQPTAG